MLASPQVYRATVLRYRGVNGEHLAVGVELAWLKSKWYKAHGGPMRRTDEHIPILQ